jgi:hypothetical protein
MRRDSDFREVLFWNRFPFEVARVTRLSHLRVIGSIGYLESGAAIADGAWMDARPESFPAAEDARR